MVRRRRTELEPRLSWAYFPSRQGGGPMGHEYMFTRDVPLGLMPLRGTRDRPQYAVHLSPSNADIEGWLPGFLHIGQFGHDDVDEALVEFIDTAAHYLAYSGETYFELIPGVGPARVAPYAR